MICLVILNDYTHTHLGLFKDTVCIAQISDENQKTSKLLVAHIDTLLSQHTISLHNLDFIAVNQGPGPFTTLRVILSSVNGIAFASNTPLIGIDGLKSLIAEYTDAKWPYTVALYNAFNNDAYYAIQRPERDLVIGYKKIDLLLRELREIHKDISIRCIGSGVTTFKDKIIDILGSQAVIPKTLPLAPSLQFCLQTAQQKWEKQETTHKLLPLYLKTLQYKKAITQQ